MSADPDIGGTWMTAADFIDRTALTSAPTGLPVVAPGGSPAEATGVSRLARVPPASRASTTLGQILAAFPPAYLAAPMIRPDGRRVSRARRRPGAGRADRLCRAGVLLSGQAGGYRGDAAGRPSAGPC